MEASREMTGAGVVVCVMTGNFTQSARPAIMGKWVRAEVAAACGADLVVELPFVYSIAPAQAFALNAVRLLKRLDVGFLSFGCEEADDARLTALADLLHDEPEPLREAIRSGLRMGHSLPKARQMALAGGGWDDVVTGPNNILALEYLQAIRKEGGGIRPNFVRRVGGGHKSVGRGPADWPPYVGASAIREALHAGAGAGEVAAAMPAASSGALARAIAAGAVAGYGDYDGAVLFALRKAGPKAVADAPYASGGFEGAVAKALDKAADLDGLCRSLTSRRHTYSHARRVLMYAAMGVTRERMDAYDSCGGPQYARVLALSGAGARKLSRLRRVGGLRLISRYSHVRGMGEEGQSMFGFDCLASDLYFGPSGRMGPGRCDWPAGRPDCVMGPAVLP